jgi:uncharacterized protein (TIGR03435 family)
MKNPRARAAYRWTVGLAAALAVVIVSSSTGATAPQGNGASQRPAFEAATVKLAPPDVARVVTLPQPAAPNRLTIPSMTLITMIYGAYGGGGLNTAMRVTGGPDWIRNTTFAVEGVAPGRPTLLEFRLMLQTLLEERFALKIRTETTTNDMLTLVKGRSDGTLGPKVRPWSGACPSVMPALYLQAPRRALANGQPLSADDHGVAECPTGYRPSGLLLDGVTMATVAEVLSLPPGRALLGTIVTDQTGLAGRYTMELDYPFPPQGTANPPDMSVPSLSTAIQEQWGLRIVPGKGPFKTVIVEAAQLPTPN